MTREIIAKEGFGLKGINKGLVATIGRHNVWNMIYFGLYHSVKDVLPQYQVRTCKDCKDTPFYSNLLQDPLMEFMRKFTIGFLSGSIASVANIPFDVAKSRIQVITTEFHREIQLPLCLFCRDLNRFPDKLSTLEHLAQCA